MKDVLETIYDGVNKAIAESTEEYIVKRLKGKQVATGNRDYYNLLENKYGQELNLYYSEYLPKNKLFLIDLNYYEHFIQPITLEFTNPTYTYDACKMTYSGYTQMRIVNDFGREI